MKIKLSDNTELNILCIRGDHVYYQNATRDALEITFKKSDYSIEELDILFSSSVLTSKITAVNPDTGTESVYDNYQLKTSIRIEPVVITPGTVDTPAVTEEQVTVTMAQLTYIEKQLQKLGVNL